MCSIVFHIHFRNLGRYNFKEIVTMRPDLNAQTNKSFATTSTVHSSCPFA